jgi:hypothetical protein
MPQAKLTGIVWSIIMADQLMSVVQTLESNVCVMHDRQS